MQKRTFFGEMIHRWKAETPSFFKKFRTFGLWLSALYPGLYGIQQGIVAMNLPPEAHVPAIVLSITGKLVWIGLGMAFVSTQVVKPEYTTAVQLKGPEIPTVQEIKEEKKASE